MNNFSNVELNIILYYADWLSMKDKSIPVTDNCKYFFVHGVPVNSAYIVDNEPIFDENNEYFKRSVNDFYLLRDKFGDSGILSFGNSICNLSASGCVSGEDMLKYLHRYSQKAERFNAISKYKNHLKSIRYSHLIKTEDGKIERTECTKYIAHDESTKRPSAKPEIHIGNAENV